MYVVLDQLQIPYRAQTNEAKLCVCVCVCVCVHACAHMCTQTYRVITDVLH